MTEAERALLIAVAKYLAQYDDIPTRLALWTAIKRVEFESAHPPETK